MDADWSLGISGSESVYRAIMVDACVRSGLYGILLNGAKPSDFKEFDPHFVNVLIPALEGIGVVVRRGQRLYWQSPVSGLQARFIVQHLKTWLALSEHLSSATATVEPTAPADIGVLDNTVPAITALLKCRVGFLREHRWLDVGAGTGLLGRQLSSEVREVVLSDLPEVAEEWDLDQFPPNVVPLVGDILFEGVGSGYDGALLCRFVESFGSEDLQCVFARLHRALKPGGQVVLVGYFTPQSYDYALFGLHLALSCPRGRLYRVPELTSLARHTGLIEERSWHDVSTGYDVLVLRRP